MKKKGALTKLDKLYPTLENQFSIEGFNNLKLRPRTVKLLNYLEPYSNKLVIIVGCSGTGRDTIVRAIVKLNPKYQRIRRCTTRPNRYPTEANEIITLSQKKFMSMFTSGKMLFAIQYVANKQVYGVSYKELLKLTRSQALCFLEGANDVLPLKKFLPRSKLIVLLPPSVDTLAKRLLLREKDTSECQLRFQNSVYELKAIAKNLKAMINKKFIDMVVINGSTPEKAAQRIINGVTGNPKIFDDYSKLEQSLLRRKLQ